MHDSQIEEQLRAGLRGEADGLPLTITTAELERRLAARRRAAGGRRLSLVAAAVAIVAVGSMVAVGNGWLRAPSIATAPSPSAPASARPSTAPTPRPSVRPAGGRVPLGRADEAIMVRPIGVNFATPEAFEVSRLDPIDGTSVVIATIPGTILPAKTWAGLTNLPVVSATGWLAIPFRPGEGATDKDYGVIVVDLLAPDADPWVISGYSSGSWNGADELAMIGENGVVVADPGTRQIVPAPIADASVMVATLGGGANDPLWATGPAGGFLANRATGVDAPYENQVWGFVGADGAFTPTNDLPPVAERTGLERVAGADAHSLTTACTGSGTVTEAGCTLVETDATGRPISTRVTNGDIAALRDHQWAANGHDAWLLFEGPGDLLNGGSGVVGSVASLSLSTPNGSRTEYALIGTASKPRIVGIGATPDGSVPMVVVGDGDGFVDAFVVINAGGVNTGYGSVAGQDATSWFAGWAGDQADYDPD